jgi:hypothetical protein
MADWVTISSLATAGGTLVLAVATFASVRSANRAARVAERSLLLGIRPLLAPSRLDTDPVEEVTFGTGRIFRVAAGTALVEDEGDSIYLAMPLRNVGAGIAVIHGWKLHPTWDPQASRPEPDSFRPQTRDLYVPSGDTSFWQGGLYAVDGEAKDGVRRALGAEERIMLDLLYGDHEGGQRTISRFIFYFRDGRQLTSVVRHWSLDAADPHAGVMPARGP